LRVFLDTNVLVSAFATRGLCSDVLRHVLAEHELVVGEVVLQELGRVLRDRIGLPKATIAAIEVLLREQELVPKPKEPPVPVPRDPSDRWILASAIAARVDVLVTGDGDLLELPAKVPIRIASPREFWALLQVKRSHP
jgi:putative PIN family toxin of toxin-antitoxin system